MIILKISKYEETPYVAKVFNGKKKSFLTRDLTPAQAKAIGDKYWPGDEEKIAKHIGTSTTMFDTLEGLVKEFRKQYNNAPALVLFNEKEIEI